MKLLRVCPLIATLALFFSGCTTVPETGRSQVIIVPAAQEAALGLESFEQIKKETPISRDPAANERIQRIGKRIAESVGRDLPNAQWEFVVFDEPQTLNAFALPGGKVGVYTGIINLASSDDEIATVMGHEVAHVTSRHGAERMSQQTLVAGLGAGLGLATNDSKYRDIYLLAYGGASTLGVLGYSRLHESEADVIGLQFAAKAGYDPRAAASFWKKMAAKSQGGQPLKWLSTHPPTQERIAQLEAKAPEYMPLYEAAKARYQ